MASFLLDGEYGMRTVADNYQGKRLNSPNDVVVKADGTIYFTDSAHRLPMKENDPAKKMPINGVYKIGAGGKTELTMADLRYPNGLTFSPDEQLLYISVSDEVHLQILVYPVKKDETVGKEKVFLMLLVTKTNYRRCNRRVKNRPRRKLWFDIVVCRRSFLYRIRTNPSKK